MRSIDAAQYGPRTLAMAKTEMMPMYMPDFSRGTRVGAITKTIVYTYARGTCDLKGAENDTCRQRLSVIHLAAGCMTVRTGFTVQPLNLQHRMLSKL